MDWKSGMSTTTKHLAKHTWWLGAFVRCVQIMGEIAAFLIKNILLFNPLYVLEVAK